MAITSEAPAQLHLDFKWPLTFTEGATRDYAYTCYVKFAGGTLVLTRSATFGDQVKL